VPNLDGVYLAELGDGTAWQILLATSSNACDRNRESIMIGPSKINNGGITFTLFAHTNREYGAALAQECGKPLSLLCYFSSL